jgi:galactokinase
MGRPVERRAIERLEILDGAADAIGRANGRVNLIGDHVDYAGGCVLPMPTREMTAVAMRVRRSGGEADLFASESDDDRASDRDWMRYARGVLVELRAAGVDVPAVALAVASDVPIGAGLSSSAALEIAVARAALALAGRSMPPKQLALLAKRAEHIHAGVPCGIMDQWCVAHADPDAPTAVAVHLDCARLVHEPVELPRALVIEIVDSGVRHALCDGGYAARRADVLEAARRLDRAPESLPGATVAEIARLPERIARRARHVVSEVERVHAAVAALRSGDLAAFGRLLDASHASLRDDFDVSTPEVDRVVEGAKRRGALGARMTGGGFGGSVVAAFVAGAPGAPGVAGVAGVASAG